MRMFQSTHPRGVRRAGPQRVDRLPPFQSTHPRGVRRRMANRGPPGRTCFNPRTRAGCDP